MCKLCWFIVVDNSLNNVPKLLLFICELYRILITKYICIQLKKIIFKCFGSEPTNLIQIIIDFAIFLNPEYS